LPIYLRPGTHAYKFIVDGKWITDPSNKITRPDGRGNLNSFLGIGDSQVFMLKGYTDARKVILSGEFNAWNEAELIMDKMPRGWELSYSLAAGNYKYRFIADGKRINDPENPFTVGKNENKVSWLAFKPNHTFLVSKYPDARQVIISGSFNGWSKDEYQMKKNNGIWTFPVYLKPGKYLYKLIVDGKWMIDPGNDLWEENEVHTGNSVLWIEP
jgi:1,4-alpha-glucan branching enzyme